MLRFLRKLRQRLIGERKLVAYLLYALGEIFLVVVGILIALQINNWNQKREKRQAELIAYQNIKEEISRDREMIGGEIAFNSHYTVEFNYANDLIEQGIRTKSDTLGWIAHDLLNYSDFDRQGNIYETMVNSGQLEFLRNHDIINGLRRLEGRYLYINRMESIHYDAIINMVVPNVSSAVKLSDGEVKRPEQLYTLEFQNLILTLLRIMEEKDLVYKSALEEIDSLNRLLDVELARDM